MAVIPVTVYAQEYVTYENPTHGFSMQYPADWTLNDNKEEMTLDGGVVSFQSPDRASLSIGVENTSQYLDTSTLTLKSRTAQDYVAEKKVRQSNVPSFAFREITNNETTVADNPAWRFDYIFTYTEVGLEMYYNEIYTVKDNKVYLFQYISFPLEVPANLPIANKMIDSFKFTGVTQ